MFATAKERTAASTSRSTTPASRPPEDDSILDTDLEAWRRVQEVNLTTVYLCCKAACPYMLEQGGGSIINTASFVAVMGAATSQISYTASKGGVLAMSRELGVQFAREGIRVNALCPGPVNTPLLQELFAKDAERAARRLVHIPMGRFGEPEEIANAVAVPGLRRVQLHHRLDLPRRRRHLRRLRHAALRPRVTIARPVIGITCYVEAVDRYPWRRLSAAPCCRTAYVAQVERAGGVAVVLPPEADVDEAMARARCSAASTGSSWPAVQMSRPRRYGAAAAPDVAGAASGPRRLGARARPGRRRARPAGARHLPGDAGHGRRAPAGCSTSICPTWSGTRRTPRCRASTPRTVEPVAGSRVGAVLGDGRSTCRPTTTRPSAQRSRVPGRRRPGTRTGRSRRWRTRPAGSGSRSSGTRRRGSTRPLRRARQRRDRPRPAAAAERLGPAQPPGGGGPQPVVARQAALGQGVADGVAGGPRGGEDGRHVGRVVVVGCGTRRCAGRRAPRPAAGGHGGPPGRSRMPAHAA